MIKQISFCIWCRFYLMAPVPTFIGMGLTFIDTQLDRTLDGRVPVISGRIDFKMSLLSSFPDHLKMEM
jgi:hypothetical protein